MIRDAIQWVNELGVQFKRSTKYKVYGLMVISFCFHNRV